MKLSASCLALILPLAVMTGACRKGPESTSETRSDVAAAQTEGSREVRDAHRDAVSDPSMGSDPQETAAATFRIEKEQAEAAHEVARERCDAQTGDAKDSCLEAARAEYEAKLAAAEQKREATANKG